MKLKNKNNEQFVDYFFKNHKVFVCDGLPWKLFNFENSKAQKENNYHTRIEYLFSKNGFFNETYKERNPEYIIQERRKHLDYCFYHRQRRYIVQELVDNNFHNPRLRYIMPSLALCASFSRFRARKSQYR